MRSTTTLLIVTLVSIFATTTTILGQDEMKPQQPQTRSPLEEQRLRDLLNESIDEVAERKNRSEKFNSLRMILDRIQSSKPRTAEAPRTEAVEVVAAKAVATVPKGAAPTVRASADGGKDESEDLVLDLLNRIKRLEDQVSELRLKLDKLTFKQ